MMEITLNGGDMLNVSCNTKIIYVQHTPSVCDVLDRKNLLDRAEVYGKNTLFYALFLFFNHVTVKIDSIFIVFSFSFPAALPTCS